MTTGTINEIDNPSAIVSPSMLRRAVLSCAIGQVFENFDFVLYGFMASALAISFFPKGHPVVALLSTFATFAVGFLLRPAGAFIIGRFGDRYGRRRALVLTITMMAISTGLVGLIPTYSQIGILAPLALVICRMFQGFAAGGEWGGAAVFLAEYAPPERRAFISSFQQVGTGLGLLLASFSAALLTSLLTPEAFQTWGWRLPFLAGFVLGPIGHYLRTHVAETPVFMRKSAEEAEARAPISDAFSNHGRAMITVFFVCMQSICIYWVFLVFLPTFAVRQIHLPPSNAFFSTTIAGIVYVLTTPIFGALADRVGRKALLFAGAGGTILLSYPLFLILVSWRTGASLVLVQAIAVVLLTLSAGVICTVMAEAFPTRVRYSALSVSYGFSVAIFGGFAPFIATALISLTGNPIAPAYYVIATAIVGLCAVFFIYDGTNKPLPE